jgi:hypothetical protein
MDFDYLFIDYFILYSIEFDRDYEYFAVAGVSKKNESRGVILHLPENVSVITNITFQFPVTRKYLRNTLTLQVSVI